MRAGRNRSLGSRMLEHRGLFSLREEWNMHRYVILFLVPLLTASSLPAAANIVVNGDFETGDLAGWTEAGPKTISSWRGADPVPAQVFSKAAPAYIAEVYVSPSGSRHIKRAGLARNLEPKEGYSVGWTRAGLGQMGHPWISQIVRIAPGKYSLSVSWDCAAWNGFAGARRETRHQAGGALILNTDSDLNTYGTEGKLATLTVWDDESKGKWVSKLSKNLQVDTKTGYIEVRLQMLINNTELLPASSFEYVAFDNVSLEFTPVQ